MILQKFCKRAPEALDYALDFSRLLGRDEVITSASATISPDTQEITRVEFDGSTSTVWLMGGIDRETYTVTVQVDTDEGRRHEKQFAVQVDGGEALIAEVTVSDTIATVVNMASLEKYKDRSLVISAVVGHIA